MRANAENLELATAIADHLAPLGPIVTSRFFGGYGFKTRGLQFAMLIDGTLYLRADAALGHALAAEGSRPFSYRRKQGRVEIHSYWAVPDPAFDDAGTLIGWARRAFDAAAAAATASAPRKRPKKPRTGAQSTA